VFSLVTERSVAKISSAKLNTFIRKKRKTEKYKLKNYKTVLQLFIFFKAYIYYKKNEVDKNSHHNSDCLNKYLLKGLH